MNQLFELKTIQSEDDLPKESGIYDIRWVSGGTDSRAFDINCKKVIDYWLTHVKSYYLFIKNK